MGYIGALLYLLSTFCLNQSELDTFTYSPRLFARPLTPAMLAKLIRASALLASLAAAVPQYPWSSTSDCPEKPPAWRTTYSEGAPGQPTTAAPSAPTSVTTTSAAAVITTAPMSNASYACTTGRYLQGRSVA